MWFPMPVSHLTRPDPDHHHLDTDPSLIPAIVRLTTSPSFAHGVFMLQAMRITTSASSSPSSLWIVVTVETLKHGGYQLVVLTTLQQKVQVKPQRLSRATLPISQTHNQSRIR